MSEKFPIKVSTSNEIQGLASDESVHEQGFDFEDKILERTSEYIDFMILLEERFGVVVDPQFLQAFKKDVQFSYQGVTVIFALTDISPDKFIMTPFVELLDVNLLSSGWSLSPVTVFDGITSDTNSTLGGPKFDIADKETIKLTFNTIEALVREQSSSVEVLFEKQMAVIKQRFAIKISTAFALSYHIVENIVPEDMEAFDKCLLMGPGMVVLFFIFDVLEKIFIQMKR